jgi:hypothetical protein
MVRESKAASKPGEPKHSVAVFFFPVRAVF